MYIYIAAPPPPFDERACLGVEGVKSRLVVLASALGGGGGLETPNLKSSTLNPPTGLWACQ